MLRAARPETSLAQRQFLRQFVACQESYESATNQEAIRPLANNCAVAELQGQFERELCQARTLTQEALGEIQGGVAELALMNSRPALLRLVLAASCVCPVVGLIADRWGLLFCFLVLPFILSASALGKSYHVSLD